MPFMNQEGGEFMEYTEQSVERYINEIDIQ